jgi:hypothetical protein
VDIRTVTVGAPLHVAIHPQAATARWALSEQGNLMTTLFFVQCVDISCSRKELA